MPSKFFYAVRVGRRPGVYNSWEECKEQIHKFSGAQHQRFTNKAEAEEFARPSTSHGSGNDTSDSESGSQASDDDTPEARAQASEAGPSAAQDDEESEYEVIYTDGLCKRNGLKGAQDGMGVWHNEGNERNIANATAEETKKTNNVAALKAIKHALEQLEGRDLAKPIVIKSDSEYAVKCFESRIQRWESNGWRTSNKEPVKNQKLIKEVHTLLCRLRKDHKISLEHSDKSDADQYGRSQATILAEEGAALILGMSGLTI